MKAISNLKLLTILISMGWLSSITLAQNPNSNAGGTNWKLTGNQTTTTDFIGTTNTNSLVLKCNNIKALEISADTSAVFMGNVVLEKLRPVTPLPIGEVRVVTADNNGKLTSLDRSGLINAIYEPLPQCPIDKNGLFVPTWSSKGLTPTLGAIFTGVNCPAWVGIGTDNPTATLDVRGKSFFASDLQVFANASKMVIGAASSEDLGHGTSYLGFNAQRFGSANGIWQTSSDGPHNGGAVIYGDIFGSLRFATLPYTNTPNQGQNTVPDATVAENTRLFIHRDGNIGIGTVTPTATLAISADATQITKSLIVKDVVSGKDVFRVLSDGHVWATKVIVQETPFPDYVFNTNYNLMPLIELEKYIKENKHLPNMPTAQQVEKEGADLGEINRILVEKVEELTLYLINMQKNYSALQEKLTELETKMNNH